MTALALGCSHTAGVGIDPADCYVTVLSAQLGIPIDNLGVPGGNHMHVQNNLVRALKYTRRPDFVVAQWPNPFRRTTYYNNIARDENIATAQTPFLELLRAGEKNFYQPWLDAIVVSDLLCKTATVPVIHIMIENVDEQYHSYLAQYNIQLHVDRKTPEETWLMDSAASDNLHHSAHCHQQWAQRLFGLLNERLG